MTKKFTSKNYTLTMFWLPQLHSFCVHDTFKVQNMLTIWIKV